MREATRIPSIVHLLAVVASVAEHGGDEVRGIAALLHVDPEGKGGAGRQ